MKRGSEHPFIDMRNFVEDLLAALSHHFIKIEEQVQNDSRYRAGNNTAAEQDVEHFRHLGEERRLNKRTTG